MVSRDRMRDIALLDHERRQLQTKGTIGGGKDYWDSAQCRVGQFLGSGQEMKIPGR